MRFRKYHGVGNDFVMLDDLGATMGPASSLRPEFVAALCDRHTGIGADGVIRVIGAAADPEAAAAACALRMDYYNADGHPAEMCGNGIRCLVVMAHRDGVLAPGEHRVLTLAGVRGVRLHEDGTTVTVDMGEPSWAPLRVTQDGVEIDGTNVSMGNPHFVIFVNELTDDDVLGLGSRLETNDAFPAKTNVEFVVVRSETDVKMRVWERGVGETQACGTGACAVAVAAAALGKTKRELAVHLPGGTLDLRWGEDGHVWMTGPAEEAFSGEIDIGDR